MKQFEWTAGERLMERWGHDEYELLQIIQRGLPAYKPYEGGFAETARLFGNFEP